MYSAILFDFDGTLADTLDLYIKAYDIALKKFGFVFDSNEIVKKCFGKTEQDVCNDLGILNKTQEFRDSYYEAIDKLFKNAELFEPTQSIVKYCHDKGLKVGIITFGSRWYIDKMLEQFNIRSSFDIVISQSDVIKAKPDPEAVFVVCKRLNTDPVKTIVVGDSRSDILMGKAAGSKTVLVLYEKYKYFSDINSLTSSDPDFTIKSLDDLKRII
jgi:HAD superfamily hydrolase (TIGR01549 family)